MRPRRCRQPCSPSCGCCRPRASTAIFCSPSCWPATAGCWSVSGQRIAYLRELQRQHDVAVLVVHHAKKGGGGVRAGQALRGSSEFHAWGDSNLYLRRDGDDLSLSVEHRAAPSMTPITIELA